MVCDICGKNSATVHLTEIIDEKMTELHLCEHCAQEKGAQMEQHFGLSDLLAGLADFSAGVATPEDLKIKCPNCGMTYEDFKKIGRLGCGDCYSSFKKYLVPLLKRIHGSSQHVGKAPLKKIKGMKARNELQQLKDKMQKAIAEEAFEEAAKIRDKIKALEQKANTEKDKEDAA